MSTNYMRQRRIAREIQLVTKNTPPGMTIKIDEQNTDYWKAIIDGPPDTPYEGGKFTLDIFFPETYPYTAPVVKFATRVYHPNISFFGKICLDTLKEVGWVASMQTTVLIQTIQQLLASPNLEDPLNLEVNNLWVSNPTEAKAKAKEYTLKYAH